MYRVKERSGRPCKVSKKKISEFSEVNQVDPYHASHDSDADPDYSQSSSDSENAVNLQNHNNEGQPILQKGKKRWRNPEEWARNQTKFHRNSGKQYINSADNVVSEKRQEPRLIALLIPKLDAIPTPPYNRLFSEQNDYTNIPASGVP
ncbi:hypothetical protein QE152_g13322 [Popillia japonica]|uniref:Uncharacterized protein n=1 Tax=Popillia japonica TaxID=7064 RepID=A0AAW1LEK5_POPJA